MAKFLAHAIMRPNDGGATYTVETEFTAVGYPQAFEHIQGLSRTFDGTIVSHRLCMLSGETPASGSEQSREVIRFGPPEAAEASPLPAQTTALTVNATPTKPEWLGSLKHGVPIPKPFPIPSEVAQT